MCYSFKFKYMDRLEEPIYRVIYALKQSYTFYEFILNIVFISIILVISMIFYWDSINTKVSTMSRCKRQLDVYNKHNGEYILNANNTSGQPLYSVTYNTNQKHTNVECKCNSGDNINYFNDITVRDLRKNIDTKIDKVCSCDQYYNVGMMNENVVYDGEPGLMRYQTTNDPDFFDNIIYATYK